MHICRRALNAVVVVAGIVLATAAGAADLDSYRAQGYLAERADGFVEERSGAPADAAALVAEVNAKRRGVYEERARQQGVSVDEVGKIYATQIFEKAPAGTYFRKADGSIVRK